MRLESKAGAARLLGYVKDVDLNHKSMKHSQIILSCFMCLLLDSVIGDKNIHFNKNKLLSPGWCG